MLGLLVQQRAKVQWKKVTSGCIEIRRDMRFVRRINERTFAMQGNLSQWILASFIAASLIGASPLPLSAQSRSEFAPLPGAPTPEERAARAAARLKQIAPVIEPVKAPPQPTEPTAPSPAAVIAPASPTSPTPPVASAPIEPKPVATPETKETSVSSTSAMPAVEPPTPPTGTIVAPEKSADEKNTEKEKEKEKEKTEKTARKEPEEKTAKKETEPKTEKVNLRFAKKLPPDDKGPRAIEFLGTCASNYEKCQQFLRQQVKRIPDGDVCFSDSTDQLQVTEKIRKYITLRPAIHHQAANRMVTEALYVLYPCRNASPHTAERGLKKRK